MALWFSEQTVDFLNQKAEEDNILSRLGLKFITLGPDFIEAILPVDDRTRQPYGILHGGATCVLAETLGSFASLLCIDTDKNFAVGSVLTINHLRPVQAGLITGICRPVHIGRTKHVWSIKITDEKDKAVASSELTCAVIDKNST